MNPLLITLFLLIGTILLLAGLIGMFQTRHGFSLAQHIADLEKALAAQLAERSAVDIAINATSLQLMRAMEQQDRANKANRTRAIEARLQQTKSRAASREQPQPAEGRNITGSQSWVNPVGEAAPPAQGLAVIERQALNAISAPAGSPVRS